MGSQSLGIINTFRKQTNSAVKQVLLDDMLFKFLPLQTLNCGEIQEEGATPYQVARMKAVLRFPIKEQPHLQGSLHQLGFPIANSSDQQEDLNANINLAFLSNQDKPCLFFWQNKFYSLRSLQKFLADHTYHTILLNGCLNYNDKVILYIKKDYQGEHDE